MYPFERLNKVVELLREKGKVKVSEAAPLLGVSLSTLHRDLDKLETEGVVEKVRGGAILKKKLDLFSHFKLRLDRNNKEKSKIAEKAINLIEDDSCIFIDHSTTCVHLAKEIKKKNFKNLVILTNSIIAPEILAGANGVKVILTGGEANHELEALGGSWVINAFNNINVHQIFLSVGAVSSDKGFMTKLPFIHEIFTKLFILSPPKIVLVDTSKFYKLATFHIAEIKQADTIITEKQLPKDLTTIFEKKGPKLFF